MTDRKTSRLTPRLVVLLVILGAFSAWSTAIVLEEGYFGFLTLAAEEPWGRQVLLDLVLALVIAWGGLRRDAARQGIAAWPYLLLTAVLGSIGPLAYLVHREWKQAGARDSGGLAGGSPQAA